jgi:hypothetical protein
MNLSEAIPEGKLLRTDDIEVLQDMKEHLNFRYTGAAAATVENELILCKEGKWSLEVVLLSTRFNEDFKTKPMDSWSVSLLMA